MIVFCIRGVGGEIGPSLGPLVENSDLVYQKQLTQNPTHPLPAECDNRQAIQARTDRSNRMVPPSRGIQAICSPWHQPQVDLFATRFNNKLHLCLTSSRSTSLGSRCPQSTLGGSGPICSSYLGQSGGEIAGPPVQQNPTDCTRVIQHALVLGRGDHVQSDPTVSALSA